MGEPHAITRARERLGMEWTIDDLAAIGAAIVSGKSILAKARPGGYEQHVLTYANYQIAVVWHPKRRKIVTIFPAGSAAAKESRWLHARRKSKG